MSTRWPFTPRRTLAVIAGIAGIALVAGRVIASDHQDTPTVEFAPRYDVNDVYAFPSSAPGRIVLVLGTSSPLTPAQTPSHVFGDQSEELYQIKVDNNGDGHEDLVFQVVFSGPKNAQRFALYGPVAPTTVGTSNTIVAGAPTITGAVGGTLTSPSGVQIFTGPRDDPFFIDLEQFFRILPDRKPQAGPLSQLPEQPTATSFRPVGQAVDYLRGFNDLAIVIELPTAMLTAGGQQPRLGVWGTTSRARS